MVLRRLVTALVATVAGSVALAPVAAPAHAAPVPATRVLYYDASQAQEFKSVVQQGAAIWNADVVNVRLEPVSSGHTANIRVYADDGWPRTYTSSLGSGYWYMGREAVNEGYYPPRIAAHEFGHILGLPDNRTGLCSDLMSGSSAPTSCTNAHPSAAEKARVERNFAGSLNVPARTYVWAG
jgi:snapalysin